ncbi:MAG: hypothetical protein J2P50_10775 [Hyphomicrobiaceae bacterium]|nr:hypothetical protein [Hyphomicrobiaceae bacterium]
MQTIETSRFAGHAVASARAARALARKLAWAAPWVLAITLVWRVPESRAESLFDSLIGSWSGQGQIRYDNGQSEGVRCTAYYTGGGDKLRLAIRCRSATTEVEIRGQLTAEGQKLTGTWEERTFNASGEASGRVIGDKMSLSVTGGGFKGVMSVSHVGPKQVVTISTEGIRMRSVNVTMGKG